MIILLPEKCEDGEWSQNNILVIYLCYTSILHVVQKQLDVLQALPHEAGDGLGEVRDHQGALLAQRDLFTGSGQCAEYRLPIVCCHVNG